MTVEHFPTPAPEPPVLGFCAYSGTGKTTLLTRVLPLLAEHGLRVGVVKHAHHEFEVDHPGKDSFMIRQAGASQMLVGSRERWVLINETRQPAAEPRLWDLIPRLDRSELDLVLVEGFKREAFPKIELHRPALKKPFLYQRDDNVIALATDEVAGAVDAPLPVLDINDPAQITAFIIEYVGKFQHTARNSQAT